MPAEPSGVRGASKREAALGPENWGKTTLEGQMTGCGRASRTARVYRPCARQSYGSWPSRQRPAATSGCTDWCCCPWRTGARASRLARATGVGPTSWVFRSARRIADGRRAGWGPAWADRARPRSASGHHDQYDAAVLGPGGAGLVVRHRIAFTVGDGRHAVQGHTMLVHEQTHGLGPLLAKPLVE
jgi:hypothetical protein